jgi:hypothetical protein
LGLRAAQQGRKAAGSHEEETTLTGRLFQDVPKGYSHHPAPQHVDALLAALQEVMELIAALPKGRFCPVYDDGGNK